jgi:hypothetical protein
VRNDCRLIKNKKKGGKKERPEKGIVNKTGQDD